jgi:hypothetical protein
MVQVKTPAETVQEKRRVRLERDELESRLFSLFETQPRWHFIQLQVGLGGVIAAAAGFLSILCPLKGSASSRQGSFWQL